MLCGRTKPRFIGTHNVWEQQEGTGRSPQVARNLLKCHQNISQPLGMPPKPRRNARIGWEASAHETSLERADSAPCLRTWRS